MLPKLRVTHLPDGHHAALAARYPDAALDLLAIGDQLLSQPVVKLLDYGAERWARSRDIPFREEIEQISAQVQRRGAWFANLNYEWGCSAGVLSNSAGAPVLVRVLDWPFPRMGELATIVHCPSPQGAWSHVTWPGCVGVLQANAPQRFAAVINQAPCCSFGLGQYAGRAVGWLHSKWRWVQSQGIPPVLLLRQVMMSAPDFSAALQLLTDAVVAAPVIFTLVGTQPEDYAIIQKSYAGTVVRREKAVSNCWLNPELPGDLGANDAPARLRKLQQTLAAGAGLRWLQSPVLNKDSRLAVELCPAEGSMIVQGLFGVDAVTERYHFQA